LVFGFWNLTDGGSPPDPVFHVVHEVPGLEAATAGRGTLDAAAARKR